MQTNIDPDYIPGTEHFLAKDYDDSPELLKHGDIVLIPQPTVSPNDPLNWSAWRKCLQAAIILYARGLSVAMGNAGAAPEEGILLQYPSISEDSFLTGVGLLFIGMCGGAVLTFPIPYLWGMRLSYIMCSIFGIIGSAWYARTQTEADVIWSQLFTGGSLVVGEAISVLSLRQMFYQHQLPNLILGYICATVTANYLGPLIGGIIAQYAGWRWVNYCSLIAYGAQLLVVIFFLDETSFDRAHFKTKSRAEFIDGTTGDDTGSELKHSGVSITFEKNTENIPAGSGMHKDLEPTKTHLTFTSVHPANIVDDFQQLEPDAPKTYLQRIAPITKLATVEGWGFRQYFKRLVLLSRIFLFPPVIFAGLNWAWQMAMLSAYMTIEADNWVLSPWNYGNMGVALMNVPCIIGGIVGCFYVYLSNVWTIWMAKRNNGIMEAESRLWCMVVPLIVSPLGMFLFGAGSEYGWSWGGPYVALGLVGFGTGCVMDITLAYVIDCYPELVLEASSGVVIFYTAINIGMSFATEPWLDVSNGTLWCQVGEGIIAFVLIGLSFPMIYWGKRCRRWTRQTYFAFIADREKLAQTSS